MSLIIRKATEKDIPAIQNLAEMIWEKTYSSIISKEQIRYMLDLFYSDKSLREQMRKQKHTFIMGEDMRWNAIAFASYSEITSFAEATNREKIFKLHKIYVHPSEQGKGSGKLLIDSILKSVKKINGTALDLNVNRFNSARFFYEKLGFNIIREDDIDIGNGYFMNDYVMRKELYL